MATLQNLENAGENVCQAEDSPQNQGQPQEIPPLRIASRPKYDGGGYDCEFVDPPPKVLQTECSICLQILREPHIISCCGHNFCRLCIERIQRDGKPCPLCNEPSFTLMHNKGLQRTLGEFHVRCTHQKAGCQWTGELGKLDQHLNVKPVSEKQLEGCSFVEVECLYCHEYLQRHSVKDHQEEQCPKRPYSCDYCREYSSTFEDVKANHWPICPRYFVSCPNECNWPHIIERQTLNHHLAKECLLQVVNCDFQYAGCEVRLPRKDMPQHLTENFTHISLLATLNQKLANQLLEKDEQNVRLTMELQTQVEMLREENQMLKQQLAEQTQTLKQQLAEQTELVQETRALKDRLGEQGEQHDALNHSVTMLREQQAQQQQEQARLGREKETLKQQVGRESQNLKREVAQETHTLKTEQDRHAQAMQNLTEKTESLRKEFKQKQTALDQSVTELRKQQARQQQNTATKINRLEREQGRIKREEEELKCEMELNKQEFGRSFDTLHQHTGIVPVPILMTALARHKSDKDDWYSEPFYSHLGGYKMCLNVDANGYGDGKDTHVSVFVYLMRGQYDNSLKWPFRGDVTIQLLNQLGDTEHHTRTIGFTDQTPDTYAGRVTHGGRGNGWGTPQFIPHTELYKYLKNDCLCFRVNQVDLK